MTGLSAVAEFHYTTTLQNSDRFNPFPGTVDFGNFDNQMDIVNVTAAVHAEIANNLTLRVGGAFPLTDEFDRLFDAEVLVQLSRYF